MNYRSARRNAVRAEIRREATRKAAGAFTGWGGQYDAKLDAMATAVDSFGKRVEDLIIDGG